MGYPSAADLKTNLKELMIQYVWIIRVLILIECCIKSSSVPQSHVPASCLFSESSDEVYYLYRAVGMVLVRTEAGQFVLVPQQVLAQAKAQNQMKAALSPTPVTTTTGATIRVTTPVQQVCEYPQKKCTFSCRCSGTLIYYTSNLYLSPGNLASLV